MPIEVTNRDCNTVPELELETLAELADSELLTIGALSKEREKWVTAFVASDGSKPTGFALATLERIGGTPCVLIGLGSIFGKHDQTAKALSSAIRTKARVAFPDEDVIFAALVDGQVPAGLFEDLSDPQPSTSKPGGEERAWGRRLAKRFCVEDFSDTAMTASKAEDLFSLQWPEAKAASGFKTKPQSEKLTIAWAWAMVELLDSY